MSASDMDPQPPQDQSVKVVKFDVLVLFSRSEATDEEGVITRQRQKYEIEINKFCIFGANRVCIMLRIFEQTCQTTTADDLSNAIGFP